MAPLLVPKTIERKNCIAGSIRDLEQRRRGVFHLLDGDAIALGESVAGEQERRRHLHGASSSCRCGGVLRRARVAGGTWRCWSSDSGVGWTRRLFSARSARRNALSKTACPELTQVPSPAYPDFMPRKVLITAPVPSLEETARQIGLSQKRARQIAGMMDTIVQRRLARAGRIPLRARTGREVASKRAAGTHTQTSRP